MRIVLDVEANRLVRPDKIWVIACFDIDKKEYHVFRNPTDDAAEAEKFRQFSRGCTLVVGHNFLGYDGPVLSDLLRVSFDIHQVIDTLIISKLADYPRKKHSIEDYGIEFGFEKIKHYDFSKYTIDMEDYCIRDVDICFRIYSKYRKFIDKPEHYDSIELEHRFQLVVNQLHTNGFSFNTKKATELLNRVQTQLGVLDRQILDAFPPRLKLIREVTPKETKHGTISLTSIPKVLRSDIHLFTPLSPFSYCSLTEFNPSSHTQIVKVLNEAGWSPVEKTETHKDVERELQKLKYNKGKTTVDTTYNDLYTKYNQLKIKGWKVNEANLETLPPSAPLAARLLAKRILLESRRRTLTEWLALLGPDGRIHGKFYGIGAWTHRMAHQNPNTANIPNSVKVSDGSKILYGKELRSLWQAPPRRLLVGVDAEAIQLRVFAHLINDPELTNAIVNGKKSDGTDPHSLNKAYFGEYCKTRNAAKHSMYAMFFGGGPNKIAEIMGCTREQAEEAIAALTHKYPGLERLQKEVIPHDAKRGYLVGLDGRKVRIPSDTVSGRKHLWMSGALQNGEAVAMKYATLLWHDKLKDYDALLVNLVHDEWQVECPNDMSIALSIAKMMAQSLELTGQELSLLCPLTGSYWNDDDKDYTIHTNWSKTH